MPVHNSSLHYLIKYYFLKQLVNFTFNADATPRINCHGFISYITRSCPLELCQRHIVSAGVTAAISPGNVLVLPLVCYCYDQNMQNIAANKLGKTTVLWRHFRGHDCGKLSVALVQPIRQIYQSINQSINMINNLH